MQCKVCGQDMPDGAEFRQKCGANLKGPRFGRLRQRMEKFRGREGRPRPCCCLLVILLLGLAVFAIIRIFIIH